METLSYNIIPSIIYNLLVRSVWLDNYKYTSRLWKQAWEKSCKLFSCPVTTRIHGRRVILDYGHTYPIYSRKFRSLNNPLIQLVYQCYCVKQAPITLIDVGANIGDTILLLESNCPKMIKKFYCIDGDEKFFMYLQSNLRHLKNGKLFLALLSDDENSAKELIRVNAGTSSAQGDKKISAFALDSIVLGSNVQQVDLLKTDVDGFDGRVLFGARKILQNHQPVVMFEWAPIFCQQTGNNFTDHFEILKEYGYTKFVWFNKYGDFSHYTEGYDKISTNMLAELCLRDRAYIDWHYDVISLHESSTISPIALAELAFSKRRKSQY